MKIIAVKAEKGIMRLKRVYSWLLFFFIVICPGIFAVQVAIGDNLLYPAFSWSGFYVSGQLGAGWNRSNWHYTNYNDFNSLLVDGQLLEEPILLQNKFSISSNGVIVGGGEAGFNYQIKSLLLGLNAAVLGSNFNHSITSPNAKIIAPDTTITLILHVLTEVRARTGYANQHWLFYVNGGWAGANPSLTLNDVANNIKASSARWENGWTVGVGADYRLSRHMGLGASYDFIQLRLNNKSIACANCGTAPIVDGHINMQLAMAHLNYLFN
jgi:opacity protein-like surface antigen